MRVEIIGWTNGRLEMFIQTLERSNIEIGTKVDPEDVLILISDEFDEARTYLAFFGEGHASRYLLPNNFDDALIEKLISKIVEKPSENTGFMPPEMINKYISSFFDKLVQLESLYKQINEQNAREVIKQFKDEVHKIAGSAGSFGFQAMTILSREMENRLNPMLGDIENISLIEVRELMRKYLISLKLSFQGLVY